MEIKQESLAWKGDYGISSRHIQVIQLLVCILDFECSRNQRHGYEQHFLGKGIAMRLFPEAFLTDGVLIVTHGGIELRTPAL